MFENAIYEVASEMYEVESVESVIDNRAVVNFYSHSRKTRYPYAFYLGDDGVSVIIQPMANGPYLSAGAPRIFAKRVREKLT